MAENKVLEIEISRFVNFFLIPSLHSRIIVVYGGVLAAIICVPTACARRPRGALGDLTALLLRCHCEPTAFTRRSFRLPWERRATARTLCMCKVRAVAWPPRRPHGVHWRCHHDATVIPRRSRRSHCAHLGVLSFSCTPCSHHEDATLVWQGLYLIQCWPKSLSPCTVTRPQQVKYFICYLPTTQKSYMGPLCIQ